MKVIRHVNDLPVLEGSVVTIGNFDGFHLGHQAIFRTLREKGSALGLPVVAVTFEPHPLAQIAPERAPEPISTPEQRIRLLVAAGVDILFIQPFDVAFSRLTPADFITRYLDRALCARLVSVGHNFRFGFEHRGTVETLRSAASGFEVLEVAPVAWRGRPVSSSRIRQCLAAGNVAIARHLLGRCYEIEGRHVAGAGRGRNATVPTINIAPFNRLIPKHGVYVTRIRLDPFGSGSDWLPGVTNVGTRPTFDGVEATIETFVPDRTVHPGGRLLRLQFLSRIRDERRFSDTTELRRQILADADAANRLFRRLKGPDRIRIADGVGYE
jgi:riboflavin kinase/FMN adenylyltransferase